MNRLALSLGLLGVVLTPLPLHLDEEQASPAISRVETARLAEPLRQTSWPQSIARRSDQNRETVAVWTPPAASLAAPLPVAASSADETAGAPDAAPYQEAIWAVVIRGATLRASPSVTAPTVDYYGVGTELNVISMSGGWFEVSHPKTGQRGWIFATHYLDPVGKPGERKIVAAPAPSKQAALPQNASNRSTRFATPSGLPAPYLLAPATPSAPAVVPIRAKGEGVSELVGRALGQWGP